MCTQLSTVYLDFVCTQLRTLPYAILSLFLVENVKNADFRARIGRKYTIFRRFWPCLRAKTQFLTPDSESA